MKAGARNVLLSVQATDAGAAQHSLPQVLDRYTKRWQRHDLAAGSQVLLCELRLKKDVSHDELVTGVKTSLGTRVTNVEVSPRPSDS